MPTVKYNSKTISDANIKAVLQKIATELNGDVNVLSGDRNYVPSGGSSTSHHVQKRAADFSVTGKTLANAFADIKTKKTSIFDSDKKYQVIHHGPNTSTGGAHLHVGRYATGTGVSFLVEGLTAATAGTYTAG